MRFEVDIPIVDDVISEESEQFFVRLTLAEVGTDIQLNPDEATIVITDNDGMLCKENIQSHNILSHEVSQAINLLLDHLYLQKRRLVCN